MFALTVDQVDSRHGTDLVTEIETDRRRFAAAVLGPDRTAGDEFQLLFDRPAPALRAALDLLRDGTWWVGVGVGPVVEPLPTTTRQAAGPALTAARVALDEAKRSPTRFVVSCEARPGAAAQVTALVRLLLELRNRRSAEGWEVADLAAAGLPQARIAERLGISPQAVSLRARAAGVRLELDALPALEAAFGALEPTEDPSPATAIPLRGSDGGAA